MSIFRKNSDVHELIVAQIKDVEKCMVSFEGFLRAAVTPETAPETLRALAQGVMQAEATADGSLRRMIDSLGAGSYLPSTREDLIKIATSCDKIANKCETVAKQTVVQHFTFPSDHSAEILEILEVTKKQFAALEEAISMLFSNMNAMQKDPAILDSIRRSESQVDAIEDKLDESIFNSDLDLASKMQTESFIELLCDISDIIEDIADKIQIMLIARR